MTIHVFTGETMPHELSASLAPQAALYPPAGQGDLLRVAGPSDVVLVIDGNPYHPPRHDEILSLLASGVAVAGAGGLGAVLAADMDPYGMTGVGKVFAGVRDGSIADDEAACQGPGGRTGLRAFLALAAARGAVTHSDALRIAGQAGAGIGRWTWADLCRAADPSLLPPLHQFRDWMQRQAAIRYAARSDAREALGLAVSGLLAAPFVPAVPWPRLAPGRGTRPAETARERLPAALAPLALYCHEWPGRWRSYVLGRAGHAVGDLHLGELLDGRSRRWLTPEEASLPPAEQARRVLVRVAVADQHSPAWPVTRADARALASGLTPSVPPFPPRDGRGLARIWEVPQAALAMATLDRGFDSPASALSCANSDNA